MSKLYRGICMIAVSLGVVASEGATLKIDTEKTLHKTERQKLTGSNIALWNQPWELGDSELHDYVRQLKPTYVRIPGGSWANHYYWNGNGVRLGEDEFDFSKLKDGHWEIDYSDYTPGFSVAGEKRHPVKDDDGGTWHVKQLHDFVENFDAQAIVTVNVGTGTPEMAAEWVRWANKKNKYNVRYWEIGNELEGSWELGHVLPDGTTMTGDKFAKRYIEFAKAMKAVDPTIKVGGPGSSNQRCAFIEAVLRDAGDLVDFVSFHTYPVENQPQQEEDFYAKIFELEETTKMLRGWIEKYQPTRTEKIEIAITEWNSKVVEDRMSADLMNGLWHTIWVGEMFRNGISFANHWDMMTATATGGHGLFFFDQFDFVQPGVPQEEMDRQYLSFNPPCIPKGQYWALYLWSRFMGDRLVESSLSGADQLYTAVTRSDEAMQVLLVNPSRETVQTVKLDSSEAFSDQAVAIQLSHHEYFWNPYTRSPEWSRHPEPVAIALGADKTLKVPPFSALVVQVPFKGASAAAVEKPVPARKTSPDIRIMLPESAPEDVPVEGWILLPASAPYSPNAEPLTATLLIKGPGKVDQKTVRLNEGGGRFFLKPSGTGKVTITATCGKEKATHVLEILPVQTRTEICWRFEGEDGLAGMSSDYTLALSDTAKPNQQTAEVQLKDALPQVGKGGLIVFDSFPDNLPKERIGGVVFDIKASRELSTQDPYAKVEVVLQSEANHWIKIGSIPLSKLTDSWETIEVPISDHMHYGSMKWIYSIRLQLGATKPVSGEIFINDAGVILR